MVSRDDEIPSTIGVYCPNCGALNTIPFSYSDEDKTSLDYEGPCKGRVRGSELCNTTLLVTATLPGDDQASPA